MPGWKPVRLHVAAGRWRPDAHLPVAGSGFDYQLGGGYEPAADVAIVARDSTDEPAPDLYNICYVNGFQTQPGEGEAWLAENPELVLHDAAGEPVADPAWPDEYLLDTSTDGKRDGIGRRLSLGPLILCRQGLRCRRDRQPRQLDPIRWRPDDRGQHRARRVLRRVRALPRARDRPEERGRILSAPARRGRVRFRRDRGVHAVRRVRRLPRCLRRAGVRHRVRARRGVRGGVRRPRPPGVDDPARPGSRVAG